MLINMRFKSLIIQLSNTKQEMSGNRWKLKLSNKKMLKMTRKIKRKKMKKRKRRRKRV